MDNSNNNSSHINTQKQNNKISYFKKINPNLISIIIQYLDLFTLTESLFISKQFNTIIRKKHDKSTFLIKTSIKTYKANIRINFRSDISFYLRNSSYQIRKTIKGIIKSQIIDLYPRIHILKHFFTLNRFTPLTNINMKSCQISKKSLKYLAYYLNKNTSKLFLSLSDNKITEATIEPLANFKNIQRIKLNHSIIDKYTMKTLSKMSINELIIKNSNIDSNLISNLKSKSISILDLSNNDIECEGIFNICLSMPLLNTLKLSNNNLSDKCIIYIGLYIKEPKCALETLDISHNKITTAGLMGLLSIINKSKNTLKDVNLSSNIIDSLPSRIINFNTTYLKSLAIGNNNFTIDNLSILIDFANITKTLRRLDLSKSILDNIMVHLIFKKLSDNGHVTHLLLSRSYLGNTELSDTVEPYLNTQQTAINCLSLDYTFLMPKCCNSIIQSNFLSYLNLEGNELNIWGHALDDFFNVILSQKVMLELNLNHNFLKDKAKEFLIKFSEKECICSLRIIHFAYNEICDMNIELINLLQSSHYLQELDLSHNNIGDELSNNYFFHSAVSSSIILLNVKENDISLSFILKLLNYFNENKTKLKMRMNISSKKLIDDYEKETFKEHYYPLKDHPNLIAL